MNNNHPMSKPRRQANYFPAVWFVAISASPSSNRSMISRNCLAIWINVERCSPADVDVSLGDCSPNGAGPGDDELKRAAREGGGCKLRAGAFGVPSCPLSRLG